MADDRLSSSPEPVVPLFSGVSITGTSLATEGDEPLLHAQWPPADDEEDIFSSRKTKRLDEEDLFTGLLGSSSAKKTTTGSTRPLAAGKGIFDDEDAEEMLSHDFNDLLVLKHEEEGIFKDVPKKVDLAAPEDDVRVPDLDVDSLPSLQRRKKNDLPKKKKVDTSVTGTKKSGSGLFKNTDTKAKVVTSLDDELFGLVSESTSSSRPAAAMNDLDDISSYIAKQQQTTSKGLFDD